jgi:hypothetical protein
MHTPLLSIHVFNVDVIANDYEHDKDFIPDILTDAELSTG